MARNEHDAMVAHTIHVKQLNMLLDIKDRVASTTETSEAFRVAVIRQIDETREAILQIDKQLMQEGGTLVRVNGANVSLSG